MEDRGRDAEGDATREELVSQRSRAEASARLHTQRSAVRNIRTGRRNRRMTKGDNATTERSWDCNGLALSRAKVADSHSRHKPVVNHLGRRLEAL